MDDSTAKKEYEFRYRASNDLIPQKRASLGHDSAVFNEQTMPSQDLAVIEEFVPNNAKFRVICSTRVLIIELFRLGKVA